MGRRDRGRVALRGPLARETVALGARGDAHGAGRGARVVTRKRPRRAVPAKKPKAPPPASVPPPAIATALDAVTLLRECIAEDIVAIRSGKDRHGKKLTPTAHRLLQRSALAQVRQLAELTGEADTMSDAKILKLPGFRRVTDEVVRALSPFPEAMAAVVATLERIERGETVPALSKATPPAEERRTA